MRYTLRTTPAWRTALERLRALAQLLERADVPLAANLDDLAPAQRRTLRAYRSALAGIAWSCAPSRLREGLPPERGDLDGWARAGIVDAIASRPCGRLDDDPDARAYQLGHASALAALYFRPQPQPQPQTREQPMTDHDIETQPTLIGQAPSSESAQALTIMRVPPELARALVAAQKAVASVERDGSGQNGAYASADAIARVAREALTQHGAAWMRVGVEFAPPGLADCDIGNQAYIGDLCERWVIVHESGSALVGSSRMPIIASKGRPHDKAVGASLTYDVGHAVRGAMCLDREDKKHAVDKREDTDDGQWTRREQPQRRSPASKPAPAANPPKPAPSDEVARIKADLVQLGHVTGEKPSEAWARLAIAAGHPSAKLQGGDPVAIAHVRARLDAELDAVKSEPVRSIIGDAFAILRSRGPEEGTTLDELLDGHEIAHLPSIASGELASMQARLAKLRADEVQP